VHAEPSGDRFIHVWYIGCDQPVDNLQLKSLLDLKLKELNDDYRTERAYALKDIRIVTVPNDTFYIFLHHRGKAGGQVKFPRVLKGEFLSAWQQFIETIDKK
jgi:hypothetical protein